MAEKFPKLNQVKALRIARATGQSSRGGRGKADTLEGEHTRKDRTAPQSTKPMDHLPDVASGPRGAKPKFDRNAYQREYMRKRRQAEQRAKAKQ